MADLFFYIFAAFTVVCAAGVVLNRNAVHGAFCLLLALVGVAALFTLLDAYLLAVLLVLVYAGAVVALFLFIIMLLDVQGGRKRPVKKLGLVASLIGFALLFLGALTLLSRGEPAISPVKAPPLGAILKNYADLLFTTYLLPVELIGFLLLVAMLGVIVLCKKFEGLEDVK
ncbi:MAG: NADH-quinone oxidoreductase subunit J [Verrucomicrobiota bacterium]|nr:NADH-quinone oxidoreductase subunit J [Verrucomicrobiota bacterium]